MNESGIVPVEYRVLIMPEKIEDTDPTLKRAKDLGLELPETPKEREQMAQQRGILVDHGGSAFSDWKGHSPKVGNTVIFSKYAGYSHIGKDDQLYRICNDKDISAILE